MYQESTTDLLNELSQIDDTEEAFQQYLSRHKEPLDSQKLSDFLNSFIAGHKGLVMSRVIEASGISKGYAYQIFNGNRMHPDKYKLVCICISLGMTVKETDRALLLAEQPRLSPKLDTDAALIICINHKYRSMAKVNDFLYRNGLNAIS